MASAPQDVTQMLADWRKGDPQALAHLLPLVYQELHRLADRYLRRERPDHTLQATALINEAYIRLVDQTQAPGQNRAHFLAIVARLMRQILVDHARSRAAAKRGGGRELSLDEGIELPVRRDTDLVALDDALTSLAAIDPQQSRIIELRFFGGLTIDETAEVLGVSPAVINYEWSLARAWLYRELQR